jgi:predicted Ser/Thr protein kinase
MLEMLSRQDVEAWPVLRVARNRTKPQVRVGQWPPGSGQACIAKDTRWMPPLWRLVAGRPTLKREEKALRALEGIDGVPLFVARPDADALVMTQVPGTSAFDLGEVPLSEATVRRLESLVIELHRRGVTHGDLHRDNILVDGERVYLVDWATSCAWGTAPRNFKAWMRGECERLDSRAVAKFKLRHAPHLLSEGERRLLCEGGTRLYRFVKGFRRAWQRVRGKPTRDEAAQRVAALNEKCKMENAKS